MSAELNRLLGNLLRVGTVTQIRKKPARVRVNTGDLDTGWLRWSAARAGAFRIWAPPSVGEQVLLGCPGGTTEAAVILCSINSAEFTAPSDNLSEICIAAPDGAQFSYNAETGALNASGIKTATIAASVSVRLETPLVECTDQLMARTLDITEGGTLNGDFTHSGKFTSNGVQIDDHDHGGIKRGSEWTEGTK